MAARRLSMPQKFKKVTKVYKDTIPHLVKLLEAATEHGFPEEHIHRIEHMIAELEAIKELSERDYALFPPRKAGRPFGNAPTYEQICHNHFISVCPTFHPLKKRKEKGTDNVGKVIVQPQPGLVFNFTP